MNRPEFFRPRLNAALRLQVLNAFDPEDEDEEEWYLYGI